MNNNELLLKIMNAQFSGVLKCHSFPENVDKAMIGVIIKEENFEELQEVELKLISEKTFYDMYKEYNMTLYDVDENLKPIVMLEKNKEERMKEKMIQLQKAFSEVLTAWNELDSEISHKYDDNYPFQTGFDNLYYEVCDWVEFHTDKE